MSLLFIIYTISGIFLEGGDILNLQLPNRKDREHIELDLESLNSVVFLGANGSGKTRMSVWLEENISNTHRVSAQKSLTMPDEVATSNLDKALERFYYGDNNDNKEWLYEVGKKLYRWGQKPATFLLNDFENLLILLHTEEYESALGIKKAYNNEELNSISFSKLDKIKSIWEKVLPHRKLEIKAGTIKVYPTNSPNEVYNASEMSDGERLVFYIIGEAVCAPDDALIIIDEPENHLNQAIISKLWNEIEKSREDCKFIFITHNIDFAISRNNAKIIWIKEYYGNQIWDYELLDSNIDIPQEILLEIIGSREPIIFVEGKNNSHDIDIYSMLFPEYLIKPVDSCEKVIESTKAFQKLYGIHHIESKGIIDRDRRQEEELENYKQVNIYSPNLAEIENFFLIEKVIKIVARNLKFNEDDVFQIAKDKIIALFMQEKEKQAYEYARYIIRKNLIRAVDKKFDSFDEFNKNYAKLLIKDEAEELRVQTQNQQIYNEILERFQHYIDDSNYEEILKVFNYKGLLGNSGIFKEVEFDKKAYIRYIKRLLKDNSEIAEELRQAMKEYIDIE